MINDLIKKGQQWVLIVGLIGSIGGGFYSYGQLMLCLLYTSDAADE